MLMITNKDARKIMNYLVKIKDVLYNIYAENYEESDFCMRDDIATDCLDVCGMIENICNNSGYY